MNFHWKTIVYAKNVFIGM